MNMSQQLNLVEATANCIGGCVSESVASTLKKIIIFLLSAQDLIITAVLRAGLPSTRKISAHWNETSELISHLDGHHDGWDQEQPLYQGTGPGSCLKMTMGRKHPLAVFRHVMGRYREDTARLLSEKRKNNLGKERGPTVTNGIREISVRYCHGQKLFPPSWNFHESNLFVN